MNASVEDQNFMQEALRLAERGRYTASPNPCVGCVIVSGGEIVGKGYHRRAGGAHAELHAIRQARGKTNGSTMYVTLEPCSHEGRTAPCVPEIVSAGIRKVVFACEDPNPQVSGSGREELEGAGIECVEGVGVQRARELNVGFWQRMTTGRPWIRVKQAISLDGGSALADGSSQWITGPAARADVQRLRARSCAVLSTAATVIRDNAKLNVRLEAEDLGVDEVRQPMRVIVDRKGELPAQLALWSEPGDCVVYTLDEHEKKLRDALRADVAIRPARGEESGLDLDQMMKSLAQDFEVNEVLVEAGAKFVGALLRKNLVDELIVYIAPRLLGEGAAPLADLPPAAKLSNRLDWDLQDVCALGPDVCVRYRRKV